MSISQELVDAWLGGAQEIVSGERRDCNLSLVDGRRYIKIVAHISIHSSSVFAFIDKTNGDILKPATWKAPAKHARGNLFDASSGLGGVGAYGIAYLN